MPHVVTQSCCSDASCVYACPVNCIHPTPDEPDFLTADMLYIDPESCVDCGACISACPVDAIVPGSKLEQSQQVFLDINADFYKQPRSYPLLAPLVPATIARRDRGALRVAVVGSGPAAMYAADEVLRQSGAEVDVFDRLPAPYGLVRAGVAPDHQKTKQVTELLDKISHERGFEFFLDVEVGKDISHHELLQSHHAVIYAVGASSDRRLEIPGADLPGVGTATEFVGWYNGHPDHVHRKFDLSNARVVIVGNGNVALDVARILASDPDTLASTDITDDALAALRASKVKEVVIVARRGPADSAFTVPELTGLLAHDDFDVVVDRVGVEAPAGEFSPAVSTKLAMLDGLPDATAPSDRRRIVFRYGSSPVAMHGTDRVEAVEFDCAGAAERLGSGLVLTSIGYHGEPVPDLPFDASTGTVPNLDGRVVGVAGTYVAGWIKRGPSGFIGTNKSCAHDTVENLIADFNAGELVEPVGNRSDLRKLLARRDVRFVDRAGWARIDDAERRRGAASGRVRAKITDSAEAAAIARTSTRGRLALHR
ncbi:FAD-dependent oxidoreductase [Antrihabitans cavernicola]|uniref:ferredoxin--NADP(+) reductase n=1 Tax=Antrihabitans cavernicola TaxID=2495913 RepID=A0A5A7SFV5_9NOCA|nr:FAD-dependent oxidoreductase [Spelaeibacter cavernicola]KAA0023513.1 4Fe-4S dicluster domain-containing protein [Spelaeibacter cavernicola]